MMDGNNRTNTKTEAMCHLRSSHTETYKEELRAKITKSLETDDSVDRVAKFLDKAIDAESDYTNSTLKTAYCFDNDKTAFDSSISPSEYGYGPTELEHYEQSPSKSDRSGSDRSTPSVDGSLKELFSSVNSLLTSRQTFTLLEGTTLETELDRLKQMGRRRSMTHANDPSFSPASSTPNLSFRRNSVDNCVVGASYQHRTQDSVASSTMRSSSIREDSSTEQSEIDYAEQKKKIHGFFKDSNIPLALDVCPSSPQKRLSNGHLAHQDCDDNNSYSSISSSILLNISPLTDYSGSSIASLGAASTSTGVSSLSCSLDDARICKPTTRTQVMTGINMQRAFGREEATMNKSLVGDAGVNGNNNKREGVIHRNDRAPRKPGRRRSVEM